VNACERTVRIFTEVLFYFSFVGVCLLCCMICVAGGAMASAGPEIIFQLLNQNQDNDENANNVGATAQANTLDSDNTLKV